MPACSGLGRGRQSRRVGARRGYSPTLVVGDSPRTASFQSPALAFRVPTRLRKAVKWAIRCGREVTQPGSFSRATRLVNTFRRLLHLLPEGGGLALIGHSPPGWLPRAPWRRPGTGWGFVPGLLAGQQRNLRQRAAKDLAAIGNDRARPPV